MDHVFLNDWASGPDIGAVDTSGHRVFMGGCCWDYILRVLSLNLGGKNLIDGKRVRVLGGGAANNAIVHRRLYPAARITLLAHTGDDADGRALRTLMADEGIAMPLPPAESVGTSVSYILSEAGGRGTIVSDPAVRELPIPLAVVEQALIGAVACCLVAHAVNEQIGPIVRIARRRQLPVYIGIGGAQVYNLGYAGLRDALGPGVELAICNRGEAARLTGATDIADQLEALRFAGRVRVAIVTDGPHGLYAACGGRTYHIPAYRDVGRAVVDEVGAGDATQATIVHFLLTGRPLEEGPLAVALAEPRDSRVKLDADTANYRPGRPWLRRLHCPETDRTPALLRTVAVDQGIGPVVPVTWQDQRCALAGCGDGVLRLYDLTNGILVKELYGHTRSVSDLAVTEDGHAVSASLDQTLRVWDLACGDCRRELRGHANEVWQVAAYASKNGGRAVSISRDSTMRAWNMAGGEPAGEPLYGQECPFAVAVYKSEDGWRAVSAGAQRLVVWDMDNLQPIRELCTRDQSVPTYLAVYKSVDGWRAVWSVGHWLTLWDLTRGRLVRQWSVGHAGHVTALTVYKAADGWRAMSGGADGALRMWDLGLGRQAEDLFTGHSEKVNAVAVCDWTNGRRVMSTGGDRTLRLWDLGRGRSAAEPQPGPKAYITAVSIYQSSRGWRAVSGAADGSLHLWDLATGRVLAKPFVSQRAQVVSVSVYESWWGWRAVSIATDGTLHVWNLTECRLIHVLFPDRTVQICDVTRGWLVGEGLTSNHVTTMTVHRFGTRWRAVLGAANGTLRAWDLASRQPVGKPVDCRTDYLTAVAITRDHRAVVGALDNTVRVLNLAGGQCDWELNGHTSAVTTLAVLTDGRAVSGSIDNTLRVWNVAGGQFDCKLAGHTNSVRAVAVTADDRIVSGSDDRTLRVWDVQSGRCLTIFPCEAEVSAVAVGTDPRIGQPLIVAGLQDGQVQFFRFEDR